MQTHKHNCTAQRTIITLHNIQVLHSSNEVLIHFFHAVVSETERLRWTGQRVLHIKCVEMMREKCERFEEED